MGLIKVGTKLGTKAGRTGKLAKNNQVVKQTNTIHARGVVQTGKDTIGFSIQSQTGKRAEIAFGYMNKGVSGTRSNLQKGKPITNKMIALPLPTGKELAVVGGLVGTAYGVGHYESKQDRWKKQGKRSK